MSKRFVGWHFAGWFCAGAVSLCAGCQLFVDDADKEVYELIRSRQLAALGTTSDVTVEDGRLPRGPGRQAYSFAPHPVDSKVPENFTHPTTQPATTAPSDDAAAQDQAQPAEQYDLAQVLAYAQRHSREYQTAKEDLYLTALQLSLERYLWTPRLFGSIQAEFADYGQVRDFDRAMQTVAEIGVQQRLPYGGEVVARYINVFMRDLGRHITSGETGDIILEADIPLLRGAGRVAYESRYQAERNLIYAVRDFERFRRQFLVSISRDYFSIVQRKAEWENAIQAVASFETTYNRSQAFADEEIYVRFEADRARVGLLVAQNDEEVSRTSYQSAVDRLKIRMGMSIEQQIEVVESEVDLLIPTVSLEEATETALQYRLDLLNDLDTVGDFRRALEVAKNRMLPDLNFSGSVTTVTDPTHLNSLDFNTERTTWRGLIGLELPLQRKEERNQLRSALINLRRAERLHVEAVDEVRVEVRDALRTISLAQVSQQIQGVNVQVNIDRRDNARVKFELGEQSNQDLVDAENDLRNARNRHASAVATLRAAILQFRLDTGTLRVNEQGHWEN